MEKRSRYRFQIQCPYVNPIQSQPLWYIYAKLSAGGYARRSSEGSWRVFRARWCYSTVEVQYRGCREKGVGSRLLVDLGEELVVAEEGEFLLADLEGGAAELLHKAS